MIRAREFQPFKILARSRWWCLVSTNFLNGCWRNAGKWRKRTLNNSKSKESITISNIGQVLLHIPCDVRALILNYSNRIDINFQFGVPTSSHCWGSLAADHAAWRVSCWMFSPAILLHGRGTVCELCQHQKPQKNVWRKKNDSAKQTSVSCAALKSHRPAWPGTEIAAFESMKKISDSKSQDEKSETLDSPGKSGK